jgi:putative FmdB family regulatory protein
MPIYDLECSNCQYAFEDYFSTTEKPTTLCPKCNQETVKIVINCMTKGVVVLTGQELVDKCVADGKKMAREASKDEKLYANLLGESKMHELQTRMDRKKRER